MLLKKLLLLLVLVSAIEESYVCLLVGCWGFMAVILGKVRCYRAEGRELQDWVGLICSDCSWQRKGK